MPTFMIILSRTMGRPAKLYFGIRVESEHTRTLLCRASKCDGYWQSSSSRSTSSRSTSRFISGIQTYRQSTVNLLLIEAQSYSSQTRKVERKRKSVMEGPIGTPVVVAEVSRTRCMCQHTPTYTQ